MVKKSVRLGIHLAIFKKLKCPCSIYIRSNINIKYGLLEKSQIQICKISIFKHKYVFDLHSSVMRSPRGHRDSPAVDAG